MGPRNERESRYGAFTLIELLVVVAIIAVLIGILLPALSRAKAQAQTAACGANLHSIGNGMGAYLADNSGMYPQQYIYVGMYIDSAGVQQPPGATAGYLSWSWFLYNQNGSPPTTGTTVASTAAAGVPLKAFTCPAFDRGGLPATNPDPANIEPGQSPDNATGVVDYQAPRLAYTMNEAICPRNKFVVGFQGAKRTEHNVKDSNINGSVILASEFNTAWTAVQGTGDVVSATVCKSHRPVHAYKPVAGSLDLFKNAPGTGYTRVTAADLDPLYDGVTAGHTTSKSRLDWLGRNHNGTNKQTNKSNFLYTDYHVETKQIEQTIGSTWEWGENMYSLSPNGDLQ